MCSGAAGSSCDRGDTKSMGSGVCDNPVCAKTIDRNGDVDRRCANPTEKPYCRLKVFGACVSIEFTQDRKNKAINNKFNECTDGAFTTVGKSVDPPKKGDGKRYYCYCAGDDCLAGANLTEVGSTDKQGSANSSTTANGTPAIKFGIYISLLVYSGWLKITC